MAGTIGIKIANGEFYPILTEGTATVKKRLVLTTVHDRQESVQIDLYRSVSQSILDAQYIGSLIVESIRPRPRGEASVEMVISCDAEGSITADACDLDAGPDGERQTLSVSLKTTDSRRKSADFNIDDKSNILTGGLYGRSHAGEDEEKRRFPWLIMAAATVFVILVIVLLWFFFLGGRDIPAFANIMPRGEQQTAPYNPPPEPVAPPPPPPPPPEPVAPPPPVVEEAPVIQAPTSPPPARPAVQRQRPPAPVSSYKVPAVIPKNGVVYQIRWGDTLWDISEAFYRNPWLYPRIARYNNIKNPDLIIAGSNVRIPPRN